MSNRNWTAVTVTVLALGASPFANSMGLDGTRVTITGYCCTAPIPSNAFTHPKSATVGPGVEFPSGSLTTTTLSIITSDVDVGSSAIDIRYTTTAVAAAGAFNGFVFDFEDLTSHAISGVRLNSLSTFAPADVGLSFDRDSVYYSGAGLSFAPTSRVLIDIDLSPVPEPSSGGLYIAGFSLLAARILRARIARLDVKGTA